MTDDKSAAAMALLERSFKSKAIREMTAKAAESGFCPELGKLAFDSVFANLWTRPGLDPRARSLVTLGILIALQAHEEFKVHVVAAIENGCTVNEIEEVIYHATGYAGFPAATGASRAAAESLRAEGLI
jgi:4-carboxymuconolactone decarboxylase